MSEPTKKCRECHAVLPTSDFYPKKGGKHGVDTVCKKCNTVLVRLAEYRRTIERVGLDEFEKMIDDQQKILNLMNKAYAKEVWRRASKKKGE